MKLETNIVGVALYFSDVAAGRTLRATLKQKQSSISEYNSYL